MCLRQIDAIRVFCYKLIGDDIAFVIVAFADQPSEDMTGFGRIGNSAFFSFAVPSGDVVFGDRAPKSIAQVRKICPALDTGK